jgi:hypothetical protein
MTPVESSLARPAAIRPTMAALAQTRTSEARTSDLGLSPINCPTGWTKLSQGDRHAEASSC